jgi:hemoglobin
MTEESLYERVGGEDAVKPAVALFYQRVLEDPELADYFRGVDMTRLRAHQRAFVTAALGGPKLFLGRSLHDAHSGLRIDDQAFDAVVDHLICALRDLGVDDETAAEIAEQLEPLRVDIVD